MSWIRDLEQFVPSGSVNKGRNYFRSGAVRIGKASADRVEATVSGGGRYSVVLYLEMEDEIVVASCTCPHYEDMNLCKHIWATVLASESNGHLKQIEEMAEPSIETEIEHDDSADDVAATDSEDWLDEDGEDREFYRPPRYRHESRLTPPAGKASKVEAWKQHLTSLRATIPTQIPMGTVAKRRIIYVADVSQSLSAGGLVVQAVASRLKKNGEWGKPAFQESSIRQISQLDASDQQILALLSGSGEAYTYYYSAYSSREFDSVRSRYRLLPGAQTFLVSMLCATERFFVKPVQPPDKLVALKWDDGPAWFFKVEVERDDAAADYIIKGLLVRDNGQQRPLTEPLLLVPGLVFFGDHAARFDDGNMFRWISMLRTAADLRVPFKQRADFIAEIAQFPVLPSIQLPEELRIDVLTLEQPPELRIRPMPESRWRSQQTLACWVTFNYRGIAVPESDTAVAIHDASQNRYVRRDVKGEAAALARLAELGFRRVTWEKHQWELPNSRLPASVRALVSEGWRVEAEGKLFRRAGKFEMNVASGIDWFELNGVADFEGRLVEMPQLLKAIARGEHTIRLDDGTYGLVPEDWLRRYRLVAALGKGDAGQLRFERHQAGLLDALLAEQPEVSFDEGFIRVRQQMASFGGVRATEEAATFNGQLREYQREGLGWLHFLRGFGFGGCLADDMGLGKTVQVLALLDSVERSRPTLIVVPRSLIFNWKQEAARFTPRLRMLDHTGAGRMNRWSEVGNHDVVLTTYGTLRRDAARLKDIHFDTVVLDEAQAIKNASTESAKAARLLKADYRLALTGTPVENRLSNLWSLFEFLNPGLLGTASVFRHQVARKNGAEPESSSAPADDSIRMLSKALRPFLLRRTKEQVARELPPKTEQTIYCELEAEQRRLYDELRGHYRNALLGRIDDVGIEKSRMQILEALLRLRQAACHPGLIDKQRAEQSSAKLEALVPQIAELVEEGHKALVFSQFTSFLDILRKRLDRGQLVYEYLDGRTRDREARVRRFQEDERCGLFLISLKAGGLGLNLTAAEYVFLLDPWWNPAIEAQAIDRSHRIGQTRNVFAYRLISRDTVEEKILDLQRTKRELADAIINADNAVLSSLTRENLELLLS
jgi:superfamily II DNA or RNA helicase